MRISDWSSDVCSSDLLVAGRLGFSPTDDQRALLQRSMSFLKPRAANLLDLADGAQFLFRKRPLEMDDDAANLLRSEEHTSELQSLMRISYAVFCLKKQMNNITTCTPICEYLHRI